MPRQIAAGFELHQDVQKAVDAVASRKGMNKKEVVRRVMAWFVSQPPLVQRAALLDIDAGLEDAYAVAIEQIAQGVRAGRATNRASTPATSEPKTEAERSDFVDVVEDREGEKLVTPVKVGGNPTQKELSAAQRAKSARRHRPKKNPRVGSPQPQNHA